MPPPWLLVNGAGGGVGGFTVQLAKEAGAIVIATASPRSTDTVRAFGADHIVDYTATTMSVAMRKRLWRNCRDVVSRRAGRACGAGRV